MVHSAVRSKIMPAGWTLIDGESRRPANPAWRDSSEAVLPPMSEAAMAQWLEERNHDVVEHKGRFWEAVVPGFYQPVHLRARHR